MLTQKQEAFCLAYIETGNASESYRRAYNALNMKQETITKRASELLQDGDISGRLAEIRRPAIEKAQYGLEQAMKEAEDAFEVAKEKGNGGAMVAAVQLRAKLNGLLIDKKEIRTGALDDAASDVLLEMRKKIEEQKRSNALH